MFGNSVKNYKGHPNSRPNPLLGGLFRGRLKISILDMVISNRKPCLIIQSEPLCENCPACRNSKPPLGNFRTKNRTAILKIKYSRIFGISPKSIWSFCFFWGPPWGPGWAQNVAQKTSFRTPKYRPNPANGGPIGGKNQFWKDTALPP